jgi:hypothetical protein
MQKLIAAAALALAAASAWGQTSVSFTNGSSNNCTQYQLPNGGRETLCSGIQVTLSNGTPDGELVVFEFTGYTDSQGVFHPPIGELWFTKPNGDFYQSTNWNYTGDESYTASTSDGKMISGKVHEIFGMRVASCRRAGNRLYCTYAQYIVGGEGTE